MHKDPKIATCCYCGTRAALVLEKARHELVCSSCGAPLHNLKRLKADVTADARSSSGAGAGYGAARPHPYKSEKKRKNNKASYDRKRKKPKKRKSFGAKLFEEAFDFIEDIID